MLYLIPAPAHRLALRLAHGVRRRWWTIRRPRLAGCRVLALDAEGRVLLVRHSYGANHWMLPGGGLKRGEDAVAGARRELVEETGCALNWAVLIELREEGLHGAINAVNIVAGTTHDTPLADGREIVEARFFDPQALPEFLAPRYATRLPRWLTAATAARPGDAAAAPARPPEPTG